MEEKRTSIFENGLIWFGAGVSIAEILTGTYLAPLGIKRGLAAIVLGHIIGCVMLFLAGVIGGKARRSAMETVKMSFGQKGSLLFSVLNVLQLVGWTAIMIYDGALAANGVVRTGRWAWCLVIGILIILWIMIGITNLGKVNAFAMTALFILTLILCKVIFFDLRSGSGTVCCHAPILASVDRRLHQGGQGACKGDGGKRYRIWACQLLDVRDWNGGRDLYGRV